MFNNKSEFKYYSEIGIAQVIAKFETENHWQKRRAEKKKNSISCTCTHALPYDQFVSDVLKQAMATFDA